MKENHKISFYFKPAESSPEPQPVAGVKRPSSKDGPCSSSPLTSCPPDLSSPVQLTSSLSEPKQEQVILQDRSRNDSSGAAETSHRQHTPMDEPAVSSFTTVPGSQRVFKDGQIVITASDDDDDDYSINSIAISTDELLAKFLGTSGQNEGSDTDMSGSKGRKRSRAKPKPESKETQTATARTTHKFSLDDLVADAMHDKEREAQVSAAKVLIQESMGKYKTKGKNPTDKDDVYASLVSDTSDPVAARRLKDAVLRTEALRQGISWSFFRDDPPTVDVEPFPILSVDAGSWEGVLREPSSRDRAFLSGVVGEVQKYIPLQNDVLLWILQSGVNSYTPKKDEVLIMCTANWQPVATEPRDELRFAYISTLQVSPEYLIASLVQPSHIDRLFATLGAKSSALDAAKPLVPDTRNVDEEDRKYLLSVLALLSNIAEKLNALTREHTLKILCRLALDETVMNDGAVCAETRRAIPALFGQTKSSVLPEANFQAHELAQNTYQTFKDTTLQCLLLKNIPPITPEISLFRCRLASAFLFMDSSPLDKSDSELINLRKISSQLKGERFKVNEHRPEDKEPFDFANLAALTTILDVAIDSGTLQRSFSDKEGEIEFNKQVDKLADRVKAIFTAIQDSGASHMKRTEAKESLQALHYRLVYTVRTKPVLKKSYFVSSNDDGYAGVSGKRDILEKFLGVR
ncbi:hypothetical protein TRV_05849 [Trichophyton verrucosum HKI 0517]|uniref:Uncharacterized protein n=1 Tax=Trichophyton verrucosum (strain HKI 0517) TaxID=663202 RepID=D4DFA3_TRIVH|nr:uncharacterized protein TRV_05849 [Trichophyton verrucosum HKI 0517]EFE39452.1 hypothetical protein TRV_05849 [Trichophyton verrucosum HKI 0517]